MATTIARGHTDGTGTLRTRLGSTVHRRDRLVDSSGEIHLRRLEGFRHRVQARFVPDRVLLEEQIGEGAVRSAEWECGRSSQQVRPTS
jgi:hypothetical protein